MNRERAVIILIMAAGLGGCDSAKPAPTPSARPTAATVTPAAAADDSLLGSGPIVVENQVELTAERDGVISTIAADLGRIVRKGQLLATFDDRQLTAERDAQAAKVRSIEADLKNWESETKVRETDRDRSEAMWKAKLITQQEREHVGYKADQSRFEVDRERENLKQNQATLRSLELDLAKTHLVAPFDGVVARRYVTAGQRVSRNDRLFWITATSPMRVKFMLSQELLAKVKNGTELSVVATALPAEAAHKAHVVMLSPVVDPASGAIEVVAELTGAAGELRPGMTANVYLSPAAKR